MVLKTFALTGFGRSGTKYLANTLNAIGDYTVEHEPRGNKDEIEKNSIKTLHSINRAFSRNKYGEVNSYLRFHFDKIKTSKKGLVLRNPLDIYLSVCNRKNEKTHNNYLDQIVKFYNVFFNKADSGKYAVIKFESFINNKEEVEKIADWCGIKIINSNYDFSKRINPNKVVKYNSLGDLPRKSLVNIDRLMEQTNKYNDLSNNYP